MNAITPNVYGILLLFALIESQSELDTKCDEDKPILKILLPHKIPKSAEIRKKKKSSIYMQTKRC